MVYLYEQLHLRWLKYSCYALGEKEVEKKMRQEKKR